MKESVYIYEFVSNDEESPLCRLEQRALFGREPEPGANLMMSSERVDPSRSPFIKHRIEVLHEGVSIQEIAEQAAGIELAGKSFKIIAIDNQDPSENGSGKLEYAEKRSLEREVGLRIRGKAEMRRPERVFGIVWVGGRWRFGELTTAEAIWLKHNGKPRKYSTALSTRVARAVVNIAVPRSNGVRAIDPCCGIGTVLVEAMSMGIDIVGREINPLAARGARENLAFFGYGSAKVTLGDMREIEERYDVAIIDMPYNLCSVLPLEEKLEMLLSARRFADRIVVVTIESMGSLIEEAGFEIKDRCTVSKGHFVRNVLVCE